MLPNLFHKLVKEEHLFTPAHHLVVGVSGGLDSMVLCHLLLANGYNFAIAHAHFGLRGDESDGDAAFVEQWARENKIQYFVRQFETGTYATRQRISIQMAARELRYSWFHSLVSEHKFDYLLTAHHADDHAETLLLNLLRGTGLSGMHGILPRQGNIVRPLLLAERSHIARYAEEHGIMFRTDSSNNKDDYTRNYLRMHVMPHLDKLNPAFREVWMRNSQIMRHHELYFQRRMQSEKPRLLIPTVKGWEIPFAPLREQPDMEVVLYTLINGFGFSGWEQVLEVIESLKGQAGKKFLSPTHQLVRDRDAFLVSTIHEEETGTDTVWLGQEDEQVTLDHLLLKVRRYSNKDFNPVKLPNKAYLDADKMQFPLQLRKWQRGDRFKPFGMQGQKKVSDFLVDEKVSLPDKDRQWLVLSRNEVVWVVGRRISEDYKVTAETRNILELDVRWES